MASVERRKDGRPGYVCRWRDEAGKQRKKSFARRVDADRFRAEVEHALNTGAYIDPRAGRETLREYAERWRVAQSHRPNTATRTRSQLSKHVYPVLGDRALAALRESELQGWVTGLQLAPGSVRPVVATLRTILGAAVRDRAIGRNPAARLKLPELPREHVVPLSVDQVDALREAIPARYRALVVADAGSGLRQGEVFGLEVSHVDFLRRTARVEQQVQPDGAGIVVCRLKNQHSYRTVPLGKVVVDALAAHLAEFPAREVEVLDTTGTRPVRRPARFIFADAAAGGLHRNRFNRGAWSTARTGAAAALRKLAREERDAEQRAELERQAAQLDECGMHDLRHFYASALIRAGLNVKVVSVRLGHANAAMTLNTYSHLWPDDEDRTRAAVDDVFQHHVPRWCPAPAGGSTATQVTALARPPPVIWR